MTSEISYSSLLIELDCLFDTRLGALMLMGEETLKHALPQYFQRPIDYFKDINNNQFLHLYANRDKEVLKNTGITQFKNFIEEFVSKTNQQVMNSPFHYKPKIVINIHPYVLDEEEIKVIILGVKTFTKGHADIEVVDMPYEALTPSFLKANISIIILYEYYKWLDIHSASKAFKRTTCPEVTMMGPAIYFKKPSKIEDEPFSDVEKLAAPFIGLKLLPVEFFSVLVDRTNR